MNLNYHIHKSDTKCPYCDQSCEDDDYTVAKEDGDRVEFECPHCEKRFWAETDRVYSTHADCALNNETHELEESEHIKNLYNCKNCPHFEMKKDPKNE